MKRWMGVALLLAGCGQTPGMAPVAGATNATFAVGPVAAVERATAAQAAAPAAAERLETPVSPVPGVWQLSYRLGDGPERQEQLSLNFKPDGCVDLVGDGEAFTDFPYRWDEQQVSFEGLPRRDLLGGSGISRDRVTMTLESPTRMHGTVSLRVNYRWIPIPATAEWVRAETRDVGLAVTPGTIVDTTAPEAFGD